LTSVALNCAGYSVLATDKCLVLDLLQSNIDEWRTHRNDFSIKVSTPEIVVQELDWSIEYDAQPLKMHGRLPDLIVCSDCVYSTSSVLPLLNMLEKVCYVWF
jgi:hypothetical protein